MTVETYVTVHSANLIEECEVEGKFSSVSHTYLFVGPKPLTDIPGVKVIRCLDYVPNYEHLAHFYDFTGWFVLAKHGLIATEHAIFLQYDHAVADSALEAKTVDLLASVPMVSYVPAPVELWTMHLPSFHEKQMEAVRQCGSDWNHLMATRPFSTWPSTQGTAWRTSAFNEFMLWFEPCFQVFQDHDFAGHLAERMIQPFLMSKGWEAGYLPGLVSHYSLDCHGTRDLIMGNHSGYHQKNHTFGK